MNQGKNVPNPEEKGSCRITVVEQTRNKTFVDKGHLEGKKLRKKNWKMRNFGRGKLANAPETLRKHQEKKKKSWARKEMYYLTACLFTAGVK